MRKKFSSLWKKSTKSRKQRKYRANAPMHLRNRMISSSLDKTMRNTYNKRSARICTGDEVVVISGEHKKKRGKITKVDMKKMKVYVENIKIKKPSGEEKDISFDPSNLRITKMILEDKKRKKIFERVKKK